VSRFLSQSGSSNAGVFFPKAAIIKILDSTNVSVTGILFYYAIEGTNYPLIMRQSKSRNFVPSTLDAVRKISRAYCPNVCEY